jgi:hypothetical protein
MLYRKAALVVLLVAANTSSLYAKDAPEFETSAVVLRYPGSIALGLNDSRKLFEKSIEILQSSNFNSSSARWEWDEAKISFEYGRAVSGKHVLVTFNKAERVKTLGGYVSASELIIGLNGSHYASSVHTIDGDGNVVGHAKYLGQLCVEIVELVKEMTARSPNQTMEPTR